MAPVDFFSRFGDGLALAAGWLAGGYHWVAVIGGILLVTAIPGYKFIDGKLADDKSYEWFLSRVQAGGWGARWQRLVCAGLDLLDGWFGPPHSGRAFARCLSLAYIYPFFALLAGFAAGGGLGRWGDLLLSEGWAPWQAAGLVLFFALIYVGLFRFMPLLDQLLLSLVDRAFDNRTVPEGTRKMVRAFVAFVVFGVFVVGVAVVVFVAFVSVASVVSVVAFAAVVAGISGFAGISGVVVGAIVAASASFTVVAGVAGVADLLILFGVLPLLNGGLDWLSWWVSRWLMRDLFPSADAPVPGIWLILLHLALDIAVAVLALLALAAVLPMGLGLANRFAGEFPWREFVADGRDHPLTQGLGVTIMLATTLIPTALHLIAALFSLIFPNLWRIWQEVGADAPALQKSWLLAVSFVSVFASIALFLGGLVVLFAFIRAGFPGAAPLLADMALWIGGWAEGVG